MNFVHYAHSGIGRSTHAAGTAAAHVRYITRSSAAVEVMSKGMGDAPAAWLEEREAALRSNARVAEVIEVALPCELSAEQRSRLVAGFALAASGKGRAPFIAAIHRPSCNGDQRNAHAHIIVHDRGADGKRVMGYSERGALERNRAMWADHVNAAYRAAGLDMTVDHRSYADQGRAQVPTIHVGVHATDMAIKGKSPRDTQADGYILVPGAIEPGTRAAECDRRIDLNEAMRRDLRERAERAAAEKKIEADRQARIQAEAIARAEEEALARRQAEARRVAEEQAHAARLARRKAEAAEAARQAQDAARRPIETVRAPIVPAPPPSVQRPAPRAPLPMIDPLAAAAAWKASQQAQAARLRPEGPIPAPMPIQRPQEPATPAPAAVAVPQAPQATPSTPAPAVEPTEIDPRTAGSHRRQVWLASVLGAMQKRPPGDEARRAWFETSVLKRWGGMEPPVEPHPTWREVQAVWRWANANAAAFRTWMTAMAVPNQSRPGPGRDSPGKGG